MKKAVSALLVLATLAMVGWGLSRPWREARRNADLFARTSDSRQYKRTVTIWGDDWLGYLVLRSPRFAHALADQDIGVRWEMEPDFAKRFAGLRDGKCDFVAATLDSYLANGNATGWPGAITWVIDESFGGDAILAGENVKSLDDLNRTGVRGAFVGLSPSEFLLRSEITHFHLDRLRGGLEKSRVDDIDAAYNALRDKRADFAVLWEPMVTRAKNEIPGAHVLIDTREAQGLIVDIALARRQLLDSDPALVQDRDARLFRGTPRLSQPRHEFHGRRRARQRQIVRRRRNDAAWGTFRHARRQRAGLAVREPRPRRAAVHERRPDPRGVARSPAAQRPAQ